MTYYDDIWEALESATPPSKSRKSFGGSDIPDKSDTLIYRNAIMRFLDEIEDDGLSIRDVREALEEYE